MAIDYRNPGFWNAVQFPDGLIQLANVDNVTRCYGRYYWFGQCLFNCQQLVFKLHTFRLEMIHLCKPHITYAQSIESLEFLIFWSCSSSFMIISVFLRPSSFTRSNSVVSFRTWDANMLIRSISAFFLILRSDDPELLSIPLMLRR